MTNLLVPGNLLIAGEYAVLEEGGLGLAVAVDRWAHLRVSRPVGLGHLRFVGRTPGHVLVREPPFAGPDLPSRLLSEVQGGPGGGPAGQIEADTRPLFGSAGLKAGMGSSAVLAVGLVAAREALAGPSRPGRLGALFAAAVRAHRRAQGGRGSGYDVGASCFGTVLFAGGVRPRVTPLPRLPWLSGAFLLAGRGPVSTPGAVARYDAWKREHPLAASAFLAASNRAVRALAFAQDVAEATACLEECRRLGCELGKTIGVPADFPEVPGCVVKALGAGAEIALALPANAGRPAGTGYGARVGGMPLSPAQGGIRWS